MGHEVVGRGVSRERQLGGLLSKWAGQTSYLFTLGTYGVLRTVSIRYTSRWIAGKDDSTVRRLRRLEARDDQVSPAVLRTEHGVVLRGLPWLERSVRFLQNYGVTRGANVWHV